KKEEAQKEEPQKNASIRKAENVEGWGRNHYFYESKPRANGSGERRKINLDGLEEKGKKERIDYSKLRAEKNSQVELKGKEAAEDVPVNNTNTIKAK
ncbi:MAG: hypothetical protein IKM88_03485, partial [Lachnospiraceae bacterium]|nr:hypothetical protein [Lachnospiraceae bacterium]